MKQIKFDMRFKEAILNKTMIATIRNSKKVALREVFEIVVDGNIIGKAVCSHCESRVAWRVRNRLHKMCMETGRIFQVANLKIFSEQLGFPTDQEAYLYHRFLPTYSHSNKNEYCYLHIFEVIES